MRGICYITGQEWKQEGTVVSSVPLVDHKRQAVAGWS